MDVNQVSKIALSKHKQWKGKLDVQLKEPITNRKELSIAYTPGVAAPCMEIAKDEQNAYEYTGKGNTVAVITDGSAVLGLGDIGPQAAMPVMEGKCALFKQFANIDAVPICIDSKDPKEIVNIVTAISKSFGGINLEDISAPRCFEIEKLLSETCDIPVFHDDQHGTAIVTCAALINAKKVLGKKECKIVISGAGSAGIAIARLIIHMKLGNVIICDKFGIVYRGCESNNKAQEEIAQVTNQDDIRGSLADALVGADVLIGVSRGGIVSKDMIRSMADDPIVFVMSNPEPEIMPDLAKEAGAAIVGTGRSDFPNQINNVMAFPGIFRGLLDHRVKQVTLDMKMASAIALSEVIEHPDREHILPDPFDRNVVPAIAEAIGKVKNL